MNDCLISELGEHSWGNLHLLGTNIFHFSKFRRHIVGGRTKPHPKKELVHPDKTSI